MINIIFKGGHADGQVFQQDVLLDEISHDRIEQRDIFEITSRDQPGPECDEEGMPIMFDWVREMFKYTGRTDDAGNAVYEFTGQIIRK